MSDFTPEQIEKAIEALTKRAERTETKKDMRKLVRDNRSAILDACKNAKVAKEVVTALGKFIGTPKV